MFLRRNDNGNFNGSSTVHDFYDIRFTLDIQGRHKKVTNELGQETVFKHNLLPPNKEKTGMVYTDSPDAGWHLVLVNVVKNPARKWNERGNSFRNEYDSLQRPIENWVDEGTGEKLVNYQVYGDEISSSGPRAKNLKGEMIRGFDQSGVMKNTIFDFKGNLLEGKKQLATAYKATVDWSFLTPEHTLPGLDAAADSKLQAGEFQTLTEYDALNRPTLTTQPDGSQYRPTYNKANLIKKMATRLPHENAFSEIVTGTDHNAKKQRTAIYYGNGSKTRFTYDPATFRLTRLLTTRNTGQDIMQDLNYTFDAVGNIVELIENAQQTQYFNNTIINPKNKFTYDSLYRLLKATGREKNNLPPPSSNGYVPDWIPTNGKSGQTLSTYCERYIYDPLGNILELSHRDTCGGTENWKRTYVYNNGFPNNYLLSTYTGGTPPSSPQYSYDAHGNMLSMPHLQAMNWNFAGQLKSTEKTGETVYYVYSNGERIRKVVVDTSGTTEKIKYERIYFGDYELYRKYDPSGNITTERATHHIKDEKQTAALLEVKTINAGEPAANPRTIGRYQYTNQLNSAMLELNEAAEILSYEEYHPFGTTSFEMHTNDREVSLKRYKYVHKERDEETGLYFYGARYYAGWLCRFVSVDAMKDDYPELTTFQYASNNPITNIDLDGLEGIDGLDYFSIYRPAAQKAKNEAEQKRGSNQNISPENKPEPQSVPKKNNTSEIPDSIKTHSQFTPHQDDLKNISQPDYGAMAKKIDVDKNVLKAIGSVESKGAGFYKNGDPKVRFEGNWFKKYLEQKNIDITKEKYTGLVYEYVDREKYQHGPKIYEKALSLDKEAAMKSTSFGEFQIMGFNYKLAGFDSVEDFAKAQESTAGQVESFLNFVLNRNGMLEAIKEKDFKKIALLYNGEDYAAGNYDVKIQNAYNKLKRK